MQGVTSEKGKGVSLGVGKGLVAKLLAPINGLERRLNITNSPRSKGPVLPGSDYPLNV
jgi:hypothetical protein